MVKVWFRVSDYVRDPKTQADAVAIMAAKVGVKPEEYAAAIPGTFFLSLEEAKKRFAKGEGLDSVYGSTKIADDFNMANKVYKASQSADDYIVPDLVTSLSMHLPCGGDAGSRCGSRCRPGAGRCWSRGPSWCRCWSGRR